MKNIVKGVIVHTWKSLIHHSHFLVSHALVMPHFLSCLLLNCTAARKTIKDPVSFLIIAL